MTMLKKNYIFQADWFSEQIPWWDVQLARFKGKPNLHFLEIGSFEGRSTVWLLENILTDASSKLTCIDTFSGSPEHENTTLHISEIEKHFRHNIKESGSELKVIVKKGFSRDILPTLAPCSYDCIYIDGSHKASDVLEDAVLSKLLLKKGGIIIFDDYVWEEGGR
jgi:predicted O-methyltransferase YrrM